MSDPTALSLKESIYIAQGAGAVTARLRILVLQFVQAQVWSRFQCTFSLAAAAAVARRWIDKVAIGADLALWASESLDPSHLHHGLSEVLEEGFGIFSIANNVILDSGAGRIDHDAIRMKSSVAQ